MIHFKFLVLLVVTDSTMRSLKYEFPSFVPRAWPGGVHFAISAYEKGPPTWLKLILKRLELIHAIFKSTLTRGSWYVIWLL